jgi:hypothetical protein
MLFDDSQITTTLSNSCTLTWPDGDTLHVANNGLHYGLKHAFASVDTYHDFAAANITSDVVHARLGHCGPERAVKAMRTSAGLPNSDNFRKDLSDLTRANVAALQNLRTAAVCQNTSSHVLGSVYNQIFAARFLVLSAAIITISCHLSTAGADYWISIFSKTNQLHLY